MLLKDEERFLHYQPLHRRQHVRHRHDQPLALSGSSFKKDNLTETFLYLQTPYRGHELA